MKKLALLSVFLSSLAFADNVLLQAGSSATITPGMQATVVSCAAGVGGLGTSTIPQPVQEVKCTLHWTSVFGDTRPVIIGVGATPDLARAQVEKRCKAQTDVAAADKCASEVSGSDCILVKY